jgi:hypothetical protein
LLLSAKFLEHCDSALSQTPEHGYRR